MFLSLFIVLENVQEQLVKENEKSAKIKHKMP